MRYFFFRLVFPIVISLAGTGTLFAESVFLFDGSIVEGKIVRENDAGIVLKKYSDSKESAFKYSDIVRISYGNDYRKKSYMRLKSGKMISGFVVEETKNQYIYRLSLTSPEEFRVSREEVVTLSEEQFMSKGVYYSLGILPGAAQMYSKRDVRGGVILGASIASFAFSGYSYYDYRKKRNAYQSLRRGESSSVFDSKYDAYRKSSVKLAWSLCISGLVYAANWVDVLYHGRELFGADSSDTREPSVRLDLSVGPRAILCRTEGNSIQRGLTAYDDGLCMYLGAVMRF